MRSIKLVVTLIGLIVILSTNGFGKITREQPARQVATAAAQQPVPPRREQQENEEPGKKTFTLMIEGALREFVIYRPANLPVNRSTPVVSPFTARGDRARAFMKTPAGGRRPTAKASWPFSLRR